MLGVMPEKKQTSIVIVGGGFAGVKTALNLANHPDFKVKLISNNTRFEYHGALYRSAVGRSPREVVIPLREIFADTNVEVVLDEIGYVDPKKKIVVSKEGEIYGYDSLILALGNTINYFGIHSLAENTDNINSIGATIKLRKKLITLFSTSHQNPVRVAIVGAGATGVELAGELPAFASMVARKHNIKTPKLDVVLVDNADRILPNLSPKSSEKATKRLIELGVEIHLNISVESCTKGELCMSAGNLNADIIIWTAGSKPVDFFAANSGVFTLGRGGRVVVDEYLGVQGQKDIYVLGDNAETLYSGMAQTALNDANFVSKNLLRKSSGQKFSTYRNRKPVYVVTIGEKWALVESGKKITTGYRGWLIRRRADLAVFRNFQPYKQALKTWRYAQKVSKF